MAIYKALFCMHLKNQDAGFLFDNPPRNMYTFLHFINPVTIRIDDKLVRTSANACYIYTPEMHMYYMAQPLPMLHNYIQFTIEDPEGTLLLPPVRKIFYTDMQERITNIIEDLSWHRDNRPDGWEAKADQIIQYLFHCLVDEQRRHPFLGAASANSRFQDLRSRMYQSPREWNVAKMADFVHMSRSHFSLKYKEMFGVTPNNDLIESALLLADKLLVETDGKVSDIAELCGFENPNYFIRMYKAHRGVTPNSFRKAKKAT